MIVPAGTPPGDYPLALHLVDSLGNRISHGPAAAYGEVPLPPPFPTHLTVVNTGTVTITPGEKKWIRLMVYDPAADLGG